MSQRPVHRYSALALSMACALMLPLAGHAQDSAREQQLEQRVAQLEQQLNELKAMIQAQKAAPAAAGWRDFLGAKLPEYLVPSSFTLLDALPLAPNGKLDVSALPTGDAGTAALTDRYIEARDDTEKRLVEIWERVLGVRPIGVHHRFFDLGGHSLLAVRLAAE